MQWTIIRPTSLLQNPIGYTEDASCDGIFCKCKSHNSINEMQEGSYVMRRQERVWLLFWLKVNSIFQIYNQEKLHNFIKLTSNSVLLFGVVEKVLFTVKSVDLFLVSCYIWQWLT